MCIGFGGVFNIVKNAGNAHEIIHIFTLVYYIYLISFCSCFYPSKKVQK